jgi:hypothetical protein
MNIGSSIGSWPQAVNDARHPLCACSATLAVTDVDASASAVQIMTAKHHGQVVNLPLSLYVYKSVHVIT